MKKLALFLVLQLAFVPGLRAQDLFVEYSQFPPVCDGIINPDEDPWTNDWIPLQKNNDRKVNEFSAQFQIYHDNANLFLAIKVQDSTLDRYQGYWYSDRVSLFIENKWLEIYREKDSLLNMGHFEGLIKDPVYNIWGQIWNTDSLIYSPSFKFGMSDNQAEYIQEFILPLNQLLDASAINNKQFLFDIEVNDYYDNGWAGSKWFFTDNAVRASATALVKLKEPELLLSNDSFPENSIAGTLVGEFIVNTPDSLSLACSLESGPGGQDNEFFVIEYNHLFTNYSNFDYEKKSTYSLRVNYASLSGEEYVQKIKVHVQDQNEIFLSNYSLEENSAKGSLLGTLSTINAVAKNQYTYTLLEDSTLNDNSAFTIQGDQLYTTTVFDYETKSNYLVHLISTSTEQEPVYEDLIVKVLDVNEPPTDIQLPVNRIIVGRKKGQFVSPLFTTDPDFNESFTYELVSGEGDDNNSQFYIANTNELYVSEDIDYQTQPTCKLRIKSTDKAKHSLTKQFVIAVIENPITLWLINANRDVICDGYFDSYDDPWYDSNWLPMDSTSNEDNKAFAARFQLTHLDGQNIMIAAEIKDPTPVTSGPLETQDHIELYFSMDTLTTADGGFKENCWLISAQRGETDSLIGGYLWGEYGTEHASINTLTDNSGFDFGTENGAYQYNYEFRLPIDVLQIEPDEDWSNFRFNIAAVDNDGSGKLTKRWWHSNLSAPYSNTKNYGIVQLIDHWEEVGVSQQSIDKGQNKKVFVQVEDEKLWIHGTSGKVRIFSMQGSLVLDTTTEQAQPIDISVLQSGIYLIVANKLRTKFMK